VYIAHPSEAPKGRSVRRGAKGGYYYITTEQHRGQESSGRGRQNAKKKKKGGHKGWQTGTEESRDSGPGEIPTPPEIEGASETIRVSGNGVGLSAGIINGKIVAKKLSNKETDLFIKKVEAIAGENPNANKVIDAIVKEAEAEGLTVE
jgi:hypothetical protein